MLKKYSFSVRAKQIPDSRGKPTVQIELDTDMGRFKASVPSGTSKGEYEALEAKAGKAVENIEKIIYPALKEVDLSSQKEVDAALIKLDGTENKSRLGSNATLSFSMAASRFGAKASNIPLYSYISRLSGKNDAFTDLPSPCFNIINGGEHAKGSLDIQEFMVLFSGKAFKEKLENGKRFCQILKRGIENEYGKEAVGIGYEGGLVPPAKNTAEVLDLITKAAREVGMENRVKIILDVASSSFYKSGTYQFEGKKLTSAGLASFYLGLVRKYPILGIEDPFSQNDWKGWKTFSEKKESRDFLVIGDDLLATNPKRMKLARVERACSAAVIKPNQIGTVSEAIEAAKLAKSFGWKIVASHRSGETMDDFIADFAAGVGADYIKAGAPGPKERMVKYDRLVEIEEELSH